MPTASSSGISAMRSRVPACSTRLGVAATPNRAASLPPASKKKGRPCRRISSSGLPASSTILAGRSWASAQAISASRLPSTNSTPRVSGVRSSGAITRVPAAAIRVPPGPRMSRSTVTAAGSNRRLRRSALRARCPAPAPALPAADVARSAGLPPADRVSCARAPHLLDPRLDSGREGPVRRPAQVAPANAQVLRICGRGIARFRQARSVSSTQAAWRRSASSPRPLSRVRQDRRPAVLARVLRADQRTLKAEPGQVGQGERAPEDAGGAAPARPPA